MQLYALKVLFTATKRCEIFCGVNGYEAFQMVNSGLNGDPFVYYDLIILDLNMPVMSGFEACAKINNLFNKEQLFKCSIERKKLLPIIIATSACEFTNELG